MVVQRAHLDDLWYILLRLIKQWVQEKPVFQCESTSVSLALQYVWLPLCDSFLLGHSLLLCAVAWSCVRTPLFLLVLQRRKKVTFSVPLDPLVLQKGSINLSPSMQCQPRATNDLLLYFFQCFSACSFRPNWLPVIPVRVQELVGKNRASDCFRLCCCSAVPLDMFDCGSYVRSWCNGGQDWSHRGKRSASEYFVFMS